MIGLIVFWALRGSFNMADLQAEQEQAKRELAEAKEGRGEKQKIPRPRALAASGGSVPGAPGVPGRGVHDTAAVADNNQESRRSALPVHRLPRTHIRRPLEARGGGRGVAWERG